MKKALSVLINISLLPVWAALSAGSAWAGDEVMIMMSNDASRLKARLDQGLDPNTMTAMGTLLGIASQKGNAEMVRDLIGRGAGVNTPKDPGGWTPLMLAAESGSAEVVKLLLDKGADPNRSSGGGSPLAAAFTRKEHLEIVKLLLERGADPNLSTDVPDGQYFFSYGPRGVTPLMFAANNGRLEAAKLLLEKGAVLNASTYPADPDRTGGFTALMFAVQGNNPELVGFLIDKGAEVGGRTSKGSTALHYAARLGKPEAAKVLIERGADVNAVAAELNNATPLMEAVEGGQAGMISLLLEEGANPELRDLDGNTPLMRARKFNNQEIAKLIKDFRPGGKAAAKEDLPAAAKPAKAKAIVSDVDKPKRQLAERPHDYAVVVGIERYSDLPEAPFAQRDAEAVKNHLLSLGFPSRNVVLLSGEKAGYKGIEKFVETWLPRNTDETSSVFFYFSGHGAPDVKSGQAYLVPWDGDAAFLENTGYPVKRLYQKLGALKAKRVIVALDACFSGAGGRSVLAKGARPLVIKTEAEAGLGKLIVFAAASGEQMTTTLEEQGHGTFTYYFLKGLSGQASGAVTVGGLYEFLLPKVQDAARRQNRDQAPVLRAPSRDEEIVRF
jgi:ankyrin repeat protein